MLLLLCRVPVNLFQLGELALTLSSIWLSTGSWRKDFSGAGVKIKRGRLGSRRGLLHQLRLVYVCDPALQFLRVFGEELELGAVTFGVLPGIVVADLSWRTDERRGVKKKNTRNHSAAVKGTRGRARVSGIYSCSFHARLRMLGCLSLQGGADQAAHL